MHLLPGSQQTLFFPWLSVVRGVAATGVLMFHTFGLLVGDVWLNFPAWLPNPTFLFRTGWMGVDLFFVLAGFLLGSQFVNAAHAPKWPQFIRRRAWRILPLYYINLIIVSIGNWFLINRHVDIMSFGMHIFLLQGFSPAASGSINGVTWTLGTEFAFYLLLPWLAPLLMRRTLRTLLLVTAGCLVVRACLNFFVAPEEFHLKILLFGQLPARLDQFVMGVVAAKLISSHPTKHAEKFVMFGLIGFVLAGWFVHWVQPPPILGAVSGQSIFWQGHMYAVWFPFLSAITASIMIYGLAQWQRPLGMFGRLFDKVGDISYGVYLWHFPLLAWFGVWLSTQLPQSSTSRVLLATAIVFGASCVLAKLSYILIELPAIRYGSSRRRLKFS